MKNLFKLLTKLVICLAGCLSLTGCGIYSFTGTSISPDIKTVSISNFTNETGLGPTRLSITFTEDLKEYFQQNTNLQLVKSNGDLQFEGAITGYSLFPVGAQQGDNQAQTGAKNRLQIKVKTKFTNNKDETQNYDREFSFYEDVPSNQSISNVEGAAIKTVTDQLIFDIFNASVANW